MMSEVGGGVGWGAGGGEGRPVREVDMEVVRSL